MAPKSKKVLEDALALPVKTRAQIAAKLIESLDEDPPSDPAEVEKAWDAEIKRRLDDIDSGRVKPISYEQFRRELQREDRRLRRRISSSRSRRS